MISLAPGTEVSHRHAAIDRGSIDIHAIRTPLDQFETLWDKLTPRERQRILRQLREVLNHATWSEQRGSFKRQTR